MNIYKILEKVFRPLAIKLLGKEEVKRLDIEAEEEAWEEFIKKYPEAKPHKEFLISLIEKENYNG
jgi:hypothetical protein